MKANSDDMLGKIFTDSKSYYGSTSKTFIHEVSNENDEKNPLRYIFGGHCRG